MRTLAPWVQGLYAPLRYRCAEQTFPRTSLRVLRSAIGRRRAGHYPAGMSWRPIFRKASVFDDGRRRPILIDKTGKENIFMIRFNNGLQPRFAFELHF